MNCRVDSLNQRSPKTDTLVSQQFITRTFDERVSKLTRKGLPGQGLFFARGLILRVRDVSHVIDELAQNGLKKRRTGHTRQKESLDSNPGCYSMSTGELRLTPNF